MMSYNTADADSWCAGCLSHEDLVCPTGRLAEQGEVLLFDIQHVIIRGPNFGS